LAAYADTLRLHVIPGLGMLQVRELTVGVCDSFLTTVKTNAGPGAARHARTVLSGLLGLAARHEAIRQNPVRDAGRIITTKQAPRALSLEEVRLLRAGLAADPLAVDRDVPGLADFMLGTGLRIGKTHAMTWDAVDVAAGIAEVRGTVTRVGKAGTSIQWKPKTRQVGGAFTCRPGSSSFCDAATTSRRSGTCSSPLSRASSATVPTPTPISVSAQPARIRLGDQPYVQEDGGDLAGRRRPDGS
jgi:hypothetical protein